MRFSNLHNHTVYSDGIGTVRENIESAISKNMLSIGFSDHSFTACDTSYCMKLEDYDRYLSDIAAAKEEYKDIIPVYAGIELDCYSEIDRSKFDYIIASVHYIIKDNICYPVDHSAKQQLDCIEDAFGGDVYAMAEYYYNSVVEHVAACKPDIIGHFDVISKFGLMPEDDKYFKIASDAMSEAAKSCDMFEINTGAIARGYKTAPYPHKELLKHLHKIGSKVCINADSHNPEHLDLFFNESVEILREVGFGSFYVFNGKGFDEIKI